MLDIITPNNVQVLNLGANAVSTSTAIGSLSVRISSQVGVHVAVGSNPVVSTSSLYVPAGMTSMPISITQNHKIAVLNATATADAKVSIIY